MKSELQIEVASRAGNTYLKRAYCTQPFKLADTTEDKTNGSLHLMIRSSSPGILDGDEYEITLNLAENTHLQVHTQSYQRLFRMEHGASQTMVVKLAAGSSLHYIPHPTVPHQQSIFKSGTRIYLAENTRLIWGEILTCGRKHSGEVFTFTTYQNIIQIYRGQRLILKDQVLLRPATQPIAALGQFEQYTHQATFIFLHEQAAVESLMELVHDYLEEQKNVAFGISQTAFPGFMLRLLGHSAEQLYTYLQAVGAILQDAALLPELKFSESEIEINTPVL